MKNLLAGLLLIFGLAARAQTFTPIHNYQQPDGLSVYKYFGVPYGPTPVLNVTRTVPGAVFYNTTDSSLYSWTGVQWLRATGGVVISPSPGVDSITISGNVICQWRAGVSTCYALDRFFTDVALSADRLRYIYYNFMGDSLKTVDIPHTYAEQGAGMILTRRGDTVNFASTGGTGGGISKIQPGQYELKVNDSTTKVDSNFVVIKKEFFNPGVIPFADLAGTGLLTHNFGGLGWDGTNIIIGANDASTLSGAIFNGSRGKMQAYQYGFRFQVGITGNTDQTKEYNFFNANNTIPYLRMYSDLNSYYRHHTVFNTDMQIVGLSTDSTAPATSGTTKMVITDANGKLSFANIPSAGGIAGISKVGTLQYGLTNPNDSSYAVDSSVIANRARLVNELALKTNVSDTAAMLSPYKTSYPRGAISVTGSGGSYNSTTGVLTLSGGGATPDSSWVAGEFGTVPNAIGTLMATNFSSGSIPSGFSVRGATQLITSYSGSKLTVTGGNSWGFPTTGNITQEYGSGIQYNTKRMPYEKIDFSMTVVPSTKTTGNVIAVAKGLLGSTLTTQESIAWDLSNGINSGRVGLGVDTLVTWGTSADSTSKMSFSTGDTLVLYYHKDGWSVTAGIWNKSTGVRTRADFTQIWNGSGGLYNLVFLKGTWAVTGVSVSSFNRKGGVWFLGDSQAGGNGNTAQSKRYPELMFNGNSKYFNVLGLPSLEAKYAVSGGLPAEILADAQPSKLVVGLAYNDESAGEGANATKINVDSIVAPAVRQIGVANVSIIGIVPRNSVTDVYNDSLASYSTVKGVAFYNIRTPLLGGTTKFYSGFNYDNIHVNDSGAVVIKNTVIATNGASLLAEMASDTSYTLNLYGAQTARGPVSLLGMESGGKVVSVANTLPTPAGWIRNQYTQNSSAIDPYVVAQANSSVYVSQTVSTDSSFQGNAYSGLLLGFNRARKSNVVITDMGVGGVGNPQIFPSMTGNGNFMALLSSTNVPKTSTLFGVTGNQNTLINSYNGAIMTSSYNTIIGLSKLGHTISGGYDNILLGVGAGGGLTTAHENVQLLTNDVSQVSFPAALSHSVIIGAVVSTEAFVNGDIVFGTLAQNSFYFGGKVNTNGAPSLNIADNSGTNQPGWVSPFVLSKGTGLSEAGKLALDYSTPGSTGSTLQTVGVRGQLFERQGMAVGNASTLTRGLDLLADFKSTTTGFAPPRMTSAQRDLIPTGILTFSLNVAGSGYSNGVVGLSFSGGAGSGAAGYATISGGVVQSVTLTNRGSGYTSAPTATLTSGAGTGATFTITVGATLGNTIYCTDCTATNGHTGVTQTYNGPTNGWENYY